MTVARAKEAYIRYQASAYRSDDRTSLCERAMSTYGHIMESERRLQRKYDREVTTVMLTRRQSPLDDSGDWIPPVTLHGRLANTWASIRNAIDYRLDKHGLDYEYLALTAYTESCATPHQHILLWVDDPNNTVSTDMFRPVIAKHVADVPTAYEKHHRAGAVTVQHTPDTADVPAKASHILDQSATAQDRSVPATTAVATYVASQHPHLYLRHVVGTSAGAHGDEQLNTLLEGGAAAWASPHRTITSSAGIALS